jgi:hypothetical protein
MGAQDRGKTEDVVDGENQRALYQAIDDETVLLGIDLRHTGMVAFVMQAAGRASSSSRRSSRRRLALFRKARGCTEEVVRFSCCGGRSRIELAADTVPVLVATVLAA